MALSYESAQTSAPCLASARAEAAWGQRRRLVSLAACSLRHREDAEDVASEAISRVLSAEVPIEAIPAWLTTVTRRLVVDEVRKRQRHLRLVTRLGAVLEPHVESEIEQRLDQAEADWLLGIVAELPPRQREAMLAHASGRDIAGVAEMLGITYKAAEHLIGRARAGLRATAKATWVAVPAFFTMRTLRRSIAVTPSAALVVTASLGLLVIVQAEKREAKAPVTAQGVRTIPAIVTDTSGAPAGATLVSSDDTMPALPARMDLLDAASGPVPTSYLAVPGNPVAQTHHTVSGVVAGVPTSLPASFGGAARVRKIVCVVSGSCTRVSMGGSVQSLPHL